ncbi:cyclase family protein [Desulfohalobium retbaense]|uniref:Cyclase family protein n=1 Tax=Desulfohalobium retbaense (strain ATCC 49708 / DSM 5692 / JCM 16813 / HR100) TaxID=485915 RepID=C8X400_DESRD|nr:cyclase family protein [Desulfohalobium retbaense]ACV69147.1 cyclase family protein [Desulfohalobium retbaense DSM 5692]
MKVIDLSHSLSSHTPVYPGTAPPTIEPACTVLEHGFAETAISMWSHTGTHLDAPSHLKSMGKSLDDFDMAHFYGPGLCIDLSHVHGCCIGLAELEPYAQILREVDFVLLATGWDQYWGHEAYFHDYPVLAPGAAKWLSGFRLKGVGLDTLSADRDDSVKFPVHQVLLDQDIVLVENLTNLLQLPQSDFSFSCFPLSITGGDGSPTRAVGIVE